MSNLPPKPSDDDFPDTDEPVEGVVIPRIRGALIVLDGPDGSGKSTLVKALVAALRERGYDALADAEPTRGPYGQLARKAIAENRPKLEATFLMMADRIVHAEVLRERLARGEVVVCDRYYYSGLVYQEAATPGLSKHLWAAHVGWALRPDHAIICHAHRDVLRQRREARGNMDAYDADQAFQDRLLHGYTRIVTEFSECVPLNTDAPIEKLLDEVLPPIEALLESLGTPKARLL